MRYTLYFLLAAFLFTRCSSDIDLTAPYEDITIVYGLLDQSRDIHFIKINKAFLGDSSLEDMAAIRDSVQYDESQIVSKRIEAWNGDIKTNEWELQDSLVEAINETIFYVDGITDPNRVVYYFEEANLNQDATYKLVVEIEGKDAKVIGETELITNSQGAISKPVSNLPGQLNTNQTINFATVNSTVNNSYPDYSFRWNAEVSAKRYELNLEFRYIENTWTDANHTDLISSEEKTYSWDLGTVTTETSNGTEELDKIVSGELFFLELAANLEENPNITREIGVLDENVAMNHYSAFNFVLTIGDDDLNSFLEFNEPATGLAQERPQWTNVVNGQGLFSARLQQKSINVKLHGQSIEELCIGQHTNGLNFCTKDEVYSEEGYFCN